MRKNQISELYLNFQSTQPLIYTYTPQLGEKDPCQCKYDWVTIRNLFDRSLGNVLNLLDSSATNLSTKKIGDLGDKLLPLIDFSQKKVEVNLRYYSYLQKKFIKSMSSKKYWKAPKSQDIELQSCRVVSRSLKKVATIIKNFYNIGVANASKLQAQAKKGIGKDSVSAGSEFSNFDDLNPDVKNLALILTETQKLVASYTF